MSKQIKFLIISENSYIAEAPEDMTLKQFIKQCDRIEDYLGWIGTKTYEGTCETEIFFTYDDVRTTSKYVEIDGILGKDKE